MELHLESKRSGLEAKLFELAKTISTECGYDLYDVTFNKANSTLKVFIMDPETSTAVIEDCIKVDRAFTPYCETESWIPDDFTLEVSSPGVYRALKSLEHFQGALGEIILCSLANGLNEPQKKLLEGSDKVKKIRGELLEVLTHEIIIDLDGTHLNLSFDQIKKASLDPDLNR